MLNWLIEVMGCLPMKFNPVWLWGNLLALSVMGCATANSAANDIPVTAPLTAQTAATAVATVEPASTALVVAQAQITPEVTPEPTNNTLTIWWPEPLAPRDNETAAEVLSEQLSAFQTNNENIELNFRLKSVGDAGGIMATLRTASAVAPGAVPDLTILRRADLIAAAEAGLIQPLNEPISAAIIEDLQGSILRLGQIGDSLYGLPYALELQHVVYPADMSFERWRYADILDSDLPFLFPAARTNDISDTFLLQYLSSGGTLFTDPASSTFSGNQVALETTLDFYVDALETDIVTPEVLQYVRPGDYLAQLGDDTPEIAVVTSSLYLDLAAAGVDLNVGFIPTENGVPVSLLEGWMWVVTTSDPDRQALAVTFLNHMLDAERQLTYTQAVRFLPSQRSVLRQIGDAEYAAFITDLIPTAVFPLTVTESGTAARSLQSALESVLNGESDAESATALVFAATTD